jgi:sugar lactone lactonase YvrE
MPGGMRTVRNGWRAWLVVALTAACGVSAALSTGAVASTRSSASARGHVKVLALIPTPGFPALPHVIGNHVFEGTYDNPSGDHVPSRVFEYTAGGVLQESWTVKGQNLNKPHGVQVAANDAKGRLLLLDKTSGRIIRLDPRTGRQTPYSRVPDLPTCTQAPGKPCSPATQNLAPMPDYAAWGPDGSLYVTDYQQAVIWRVPPGGGPPKIWLASPKLDGNMFGTACILLMPDHHTLLFDQASNGGSVGGGNPSTGKLYEVAIKHGGRPGPLRQLWESGPADAPDGCMLARSGHIYVALAGTSNQIVELSGEGKELARFGQQYSGSNNSSVPFDTPSGMAWHGTDLIIANQAYLDENTSNMALLSLQTGEPGVPTYVPRNAGLGSGGSAKHTHHRAHHHHRRASRRPRKSRGFTG